MFQDFTKSDTGSAAFQDRRMHGRVGRPACKFKCRDVFGGIAYKTSFYPLTTSLSTVSGRLLKDESLSLERFVTCKAKPNDMDALTCEIRRRQKRSGPISRCPGVAKSDECA